MAGKIKGMEVGNVIIGTAYSTELVERSKSHQLDLCIISKREEVPGWIPICKDSMMVWVSRDHPLANKTGIPLEAFANEKYIDTYPNTQFYTKDSYATW